MPLIAMFTGDSARADGFTDGNPAFVYDNFARTTVGSLGTATSGQVWNAIIGIWNANGSAANTASTPSTYPMATINFRTQCTITCQSVTPGGGITFWEQNATNWWAVVIAVSNSYNSGPATCVANSCCTGSNTCVSNSCCTGSNTCVSNSCCTGSATSPNSCSYTSYTTQTSSLCLANGGTPVSQTTGCDGSSGICAYTGVAANAACCGTTNTCVANSCCTGSNTCVANSCCTGSNTCVSNSCCSYVYNSPVYSTIATVSILQNVAGTVSVISSGTVTTSSSSGYPTTPPVQSIKVALVGSNVTVTGYSDTALVSSALTVSATAGAAPVYTGVGIVMSTSSVSQGTTVGTFSAS